MSIQRRFPSVHLRWGLWSKRPSREEHVLLLRGAPPPTRPLRASNPWGFGERRVKEHNKGLLLKSLSIFLCAFVPGGPTWGGSSGDLPGCHCCTGISPRRCTGVISSHSPAPAHSPACLCPAQPEGRAWGFLAHQPPWVGTSQLARLYLR